MRISIHADRFPSDIQPHPNRLFGRCFRNVMPYASFIAVARNTRGIVVGLFVAYTHRFIHPVTSERFSAPCAEDEIYIAEACNVDRRVGDATLNALLRHVQRQGFRGARVQTLDVRLWRQLGFHRSGPRDPRYGVTMIRRL